MEFSIKDTYRAQVEAITGGKNTVMYDDYGNPNIMVLIHDMHSSYYGISDNHHYAASYITNEEFEDNKCRRETWIAKYAASRGNNQCPSSAPNKQFWFTSNFSEAKNACKRMGKGWHLTSNYEWLQIAYSGIINGTMKEVDFTNEWIYEALGCGPIPEGSKTIDPMNMRTGMYGSAYSHTGDIDGVMDMQGTVWQYVDGLYTGPGWEELHYWGYHGRPINCVFDDKYTDYGRHADGTYYPICLDTNTTPENYDGCRAHLDTDHFRETPSFYDGPMPSAWSTPGDDAAISENVVLSIGVKKLHENNVPDKSNYHPRIAFQCQNGEDVIMHASRGGSLPNSILDRAAQKMRANAVDLLFMPESKYGIHYGVPDCGFRFSYTGELSV